MVACQERVFAKWFRVIFLHSANAELVCNDVGVEQDDEPRFWYRVDFDCIRRL